MNAFPLLTAALIAVALVAGDAPATPATTAGSAGSRSATAPNRINPDPTAAVVGQGRFLYRQRDIDALLAIARRYANRGWSGTDEAAAGKAIADALVAREAFAAAITDLPPALKGRARDALVLDILAYAADPAPGVVGSAPVLAIANGATPSPAAAGGPILVRLPQPVVRRVIAGKNRTLAVGVALVFADEATAKTNESHAALLQDALLTTVHALGDVAFVNPDHAALKEAIERAFRARVPTLPVGCVLIPALEAREDL